MKPLALLLGMLAACMSAHAFNLDDLKARLNDLKHSAAQPAAEPAGIDRFTPQQQADSLRQALVQGAENAVRELARMDGYLGNPRVRIPIPDHLQKVDSALRKVGLGRYADDLVTAMNRAAESAAPEAKSLLIAAVQNMTLNDAKDILLGGDDAATRYFRRSTETALTGKFKPVVAKAIAQVRLAQAYDRFAGKGALLGLIDEKDAHLEDYVTRKALDGLFLMIADQEKALRANPMQVASDLARQVFSAARGQ